MHDTAPRCFSGIHRRLDRSKVIRDTIAHRAIGSDIEGRKSVKDRCTARDLITSAVSAAVGCDLHRDGIARGQPLDTVLETGDLARGSRQRFHPFTAVFKYLDRHRSPRVDLDPGHTDLIIAGVPDGMCPTPCQRSHRLLDPKVHRTCRRYRQHIRIATADADLIKGHAALAGRDAETVERHPRGKARVEQPPPIGRGFGQISRHRIG